MKKIILLFACTFIIFSCKKEEENTLIGEWKLTEQLIDPGDGSGVYTSVTSEKNLHFYNGGTVISNGPLCSMGITSDESSIGNYLMADSTITPGCPGNASQFNIRFEISNDVLILHYPCFEGCGQKYVKVD